MSDSKPQEIICKSILQIAVLQLVLYLDTTVITFIRKF
jgi:hypothetical protein